MKQLFNLNSVQTMLCAKLKPELILNCLILLGVLLLMTSLPLLNTQPSLGESINDNSYSFYNQSTGTVFPTINGTYTNNILGFQITLPEGWKGIDLGNIAMASPTGIDSKTGGLLPGGDKVLMVLGGGNFSDFFPGSKDYQLSKYIDYLKKGNMGMPCQIVSDKNVEVKGTESVEVFQLCGLLKKEKILTYIFAPQDKMVFAGLKGTGVIFDHNVDKFQKSIQTLRIKKP
jgi:hypothetical protein